jgi:hypothetical protein
LISNDAPRAVIEEIVASISFDIVIPESVETPSARAAQITAL